MQWKLRPLREEDAAALHDLEARCFAVPWSEAVLRECLRDPKYLGVGAEAVIKAQGEVEGELQPQLLGFALGWGVLDEAQVDRVAVLPHARRGGVARAMSARLLGDLHLAGAQSIFLEVRAGNVSAIELYKSTGFKLVGQRRAYYEDGEDALILRLEMDAST